MRLAFLIVVAGLSTTIARAESPKFHLPPQIVRAMKAPSSFTLLSIHPDPQTAHWFNTKFHGFRVLGQICIASPTERQQITETIKRVLRDYDRGDNKCIFSPRHGVHIISGGQTYDFLICFECQEMEAYTGDQQIFHRYIRGDAGILTTLLRAAKIRIAD